MTSLIATLVGSGFAFLLSWVAYGRGVAWEKERCRQVALGESGRSADQAQAELARRIAYLIAADQTGRPDSSG